MKETLLICLLNALLTPALYLGASSVSLASEADAIETAKPMGYSRNMVRASASSKVWIVNKSSYDLNITANTPLHTSCPGSNNPFPLDEKTSGAQSVNVPANTEDTAWITDSRLFPVRGIIAPPPTGPYFWDVKFVVEYFVDNANSEKMDINLKFDCRKQARGSNRSFKNNDLETELVWLPQELTLKLIIKEPEHSDTENN